MDPKIEVRALNFYPIKSCGGISLKEAQIVRTGLAYDRSWLLIDEQGEVVTQRKKAAQGLAQVQCTLVEGGVLASTKSELQPLFLPFEYNADSSLHEVSVWGSKCMGREERKEASAWFSRVLQFPVRLVRFEKSFERVVNPGVVGHGNARAEFQDGYPLHIIAEESLHALNQMLIERGAPTVEMNRFRPNIVVRGLGEFGEDNAFGLEGVSLPLSLRFPKRCSRCVMINVDQERGETPQLAREQHPLTVLSERRMFEERDGKMKPGFGQNAVVDNQEQLPLVIRTGDLFSLKLPSRPA